MQGFTKAEIKTGLIFDETQGMYPSALHGYAGDGFFAGGSCTSTIFGYVFEGPVTIHHHGHEWKLDTGFYFSIPDKFEITGSGKVVMFERYGYRGVFQIGGPIEERGRLVYIDGCSDSLLIHPARAGDACLNLLVFPPNIKQTMHIHPTIRLGVVASGRGRCVTPTGDIPLTPGTVFSLKEVAQHCFHTDEGEGMRVIAYHPDSNTGPTDEDHPMLNRTLTDRTNK